MNAVPPIVSVLMTAYNRAAYIGEAIESVLHSGFEDYELIIVDDGSTDDTVSIANSYAENDSRVRVYINDQNLGDYPNRNKAASYARGKYIKYVDSDDAVLPGGLEVMVAAMEAYPDAAFGFSDCKPTSKSRYPGYYTGKDALRIHFIKGGLLQAGPSTTIIRREVFMQEGGFSGTRFISDYEAWLYMCLQHSIVIFEPGLMRVRSHEGQEMDVGKLPYYSLNYNLHKRFLKDTRNPFTKAERTALLYNYKVLLARRVYQRLIKWFGIKRTWQTIREAGEGLSLFFYAFLPMKSFDR